MEKRWIFSAVIAVVAAGVTACGGGGETTPDVEAVPFCESTNCPKGTTCSEELRMCVSDIPSGGESDPCDQCTAEQECVDNVCVDKEPVENPCDQCTAEQECVDKVCVDKEVDPPPVLCSDTDAPTCNGNAVVSCVGGEFVPQDCEEKLCVGGECVEQYEEPNKCDPATFELTCDESSVVSCVDGKMESSPCPDGQYCSGGACVDTDLCPDNDDKMVPGVCGCSMPDVDLDENGTADCLVIEDLCPDDLEKTNPGQCGCGVPEGTCDDVDVCSENSAKTVPGVCGCDADDTDTDGDGIPDCIDACPENPNKYVDDGCSCELVHVSIDETDYCATPIATAQELVDVINGIADESLEVTADSVYALIRNINLADVITDDTDWKPVAFKGKLTSWGSTAKTIAYTNADGERLSLHCAEADTSCGLFGTLTGARIHNVSLNLGVSGVSNIGGLAGIANTDTKLTQIDAKTDITGAGSNIGGLIGAGNKITLSGIKHQGKVVNIGPNSTAVPVANTGGIAGRLSNSSTISDSRNVGSVVSESENIEKAANYLGGIIGYAETNTTMFDLTNDSVVSSQTTNYVGGILGRHTKISLSGNKNFVNNGYVKGYQITGGLFGRLDSVANAEGIIDAVNNGTVTGLHLYTAGIVSYCYVPLTRVINHGTISGVSYLGGIVGLHYNSIEYGYNDGSIWLENTTQSSGGNTGGIAGYISNGYKLRYLTNHGKITADWASTMGVNSTTGVQSANENANQNYGGIAGYVIGAGTVMENVYNTGTLTTSAAGLSRCGGIVGMAHSVALTNAKNTGDIKGYSLVGGIIGRFGMRKTAEEQKIPFEMKNVENTGNILASSSVGGIIGTFDMDHEKAEFTFDQIVNRGNISATGANVGGIFGIVYSQDKANTYKNLYNFGNIKGTSYLGGIVGQFVSSVNSDWWEGESFGYYATGPRTMTNTFDSCVSTGNITGSGSYLGGLLGLVNVPAIAAYGHAYDAKNNTYYSAYYTHRCPKNENIYKREAYLTYYDVNAVFNLQNSYFSGNITETGSGSTVGGLIAHIEARSVVTSTYKNIAYDFDDDCVMSQTETVHPPVTRLAQTNIKNSYALGTITSDANYVGALFGRLLTKDGVADTDEYKKQIMGEGKKTVSTISNLYSAVTFNGKGATVAGNNDNVSDLISSSIYGWPDGNPNTPDGQTDKLVWGAKTTMTGYANYSFNDTGVAVVGSDKLLDKLNAVIASLGLTAWMDAAYTLSDSKNVKVPSFDLKPQLATWEPWEGK